MRFVITSLREVPFGADGTFTPESFVERVNSDLANDLGNLLNRTVAMVDKYFDGVVPAFSAGVTPFDATIEEAAKSVYEKVETAMENMEFSVALTAISQFVSRDNKYIDETQPWTLAKDESKRNELASVMSHLVETLRVASILLQPFLTRTPKNVGSAWPGGRRMDDLGERAPVRCYTGWNEASKGEPIFPRLDTEQEVAYIAEAMTGGTKATQEETSTSEADSSAESTAEPVELKEEIGIEDFAKVELRVAQVIATEPVKKADKLLSCTEPRIRRRQVVSGIAKFYTPEELVGRKVICVTNLKPVKLRGEMSQGMILAASHGDQLTLATVPDGMPNGAVVK